MQYRTDKRSGNKLSVLGFGCMRLPRGISGIDIASSERIIMDAYQAGVNYYDTAYLYPGSEGALGRILADNGIRSSVYIATKLPLGNCRQASDFDKYFDLQLKSLRTDYIDYYLMHNINCLEQWQQLVSLGIEDWIGQQKVSGRIRQIGFSFHGSCGEYLKVLDSYDWDFTQIQYNYSDENYQAGVTGLRRAAAKNMPIIIMEPLLGGKLANGLPKQAEEVFRSINPSLTPAAWGLRWLLDQPEVTVILSGMNSEAQVKDNLRTADKSSPGMLNSKEKEAYRNVVKIFRASYKIPCTGCAYCMPCPQNVNIPGCFAAYNHSYTMGRFTGLFLYVTGTAAHRKSHQTAGRCVGCGKCEKHCPQNIAIRKELKAVERRMEPFYVKWVTGIMRSKNTHTG